MSINIHLPITSLYAALLAFLFIFLSVQVIRLRRRFKIAIGNNNNVANHQGAAQSEQITRAIRAHGNLAEYAPFALLLISLLEMQGTPHFLLHGIGGCLLLGRLLHAYGISQMQERFVFRVSGMALTFTAISSAALFLLKIIY
jgi:uncharacterized membrane protein YecN with MAPEG domain